MADPKISPITNSYNNLFLEEQSDNMPSVSKPAAVEQEPLKEDTLFSSIDAFSLSLQDLVAPESRESGPELKQEVSEDSSVLSPLPFSLEDLIHPESLEITFKEEAKLPLILRLLAQVNAIIPLLTKLEQGQKLTQRKELQLMRTLTDDEIGNIYFGGLTSLGGYTLSAFVTAVAGQGAGQLISGLTQGVSSLADAGKTRSQKGYQEEQLGLQEAKELRQTAERLKEQLLQAAERANQLSYLRG